MVFTCPSGAWKILLFLSWHWPMEEVQESMLCSYWTVFARGISIHGKDMLLRCQSNAKVIRNDRNNDVADTT